MHLRQSKMLDLGYDFLRCQPKWRHPAMRRTVIPVPAMQGLPLRMSSDLSIRVPISMLYGILWLSTLSIDPLV